MNNTTENKAQSWNDYCIETYCTAETYRRQTQGGRTFAERLTEFYNKRNCKVDKRQLPILFEFPEKPSRSRE